MTQIESIYEIQAALIELRERLPSRSAWAFKHTQMKYEKLVDRFFRENEKFLKPEQHQPCLQDLDYFLRLMDDTVEQYYLDVEE